MTQLNGDIDELNGKMEEETTITNANDFIDLSSGIIAEDVKAIKTDKMVSIMFIASKSDRSDFATDRTIIGQLKPGFRPKIGQFYAAASEISVGSFLNTVMSVYIAADGTIYADIIPALPAPKAVCICMSAIYW